MAYNMLIVDDSSPMRAVIKKIIKASGFDVVKIRLHRGRARLFQELKAHCRAEDWL